MKKRKGMRLFLCVLALLIPITASAHSGRTDSSGGHRDNKNKSGLGYYHYHCGGNPPHLHTNGICPYKGGGTSSASSGTKKTTPVVSTPKKVYASRVDAVKVPKSIKAGESTKLEGKVYPQNAEDSAITWSTSTPEIASVSENGTFMAKGVGTAVVLAKTERGTVSEFKIMVTPVEAEAIQIAKKPGSIKLGDELRLSVEFTPDNTTDKTVLWNTADASIATVSETGVLKANGVGKTVISVAHGTLTDSFEIEVEPIKADRIEIRIPENQEEVKHAETVGGNMISCKIKKGTTIKLSADIYPANATDKTVLWSIDKEEIAKIDEGGTLQTLHNGTVIVSAKTKDGRNDQIEIEVYSETGSTAGGAVLTGAGVLGAALYIGKRKKKKS